MCIPPDVLSYARALTPGGSGTRRPRARTLARYRSPCDGDKSFSWIRRSREAESLERGHPPGHRHRRGRPDSGHGCQRNREEHAAQGDPLRSAAIAGFRRGHDPLGVRIARTVRERSSRRSRGHRRGRRMPLRSLERVCPWTGIPTVSHVFSTSTRRFPSERSPNVRHADRGLASPPLAGVLAERGSTRSSDPSWRRFRSTSRACPRGRGCSLGSGISLTADASMPAACC